MAEKKINLAELTEDELRAQYKNFKDELFNLRFQLATGQLENVARLKTVRKDIARVMTYLHQAEKSKEQNINWLPKRHRRRKNRRELTQQKVAKAARESRSETETAKV